MPRARTVIFIGPQGSGKGTQIARLAALLREKEPTRRVVDVQTGRRFRALAAKGENFTEAHVAATIDTGAFQPLFLSVVLWGDAFLHHVDTNCHLLIDGFPRTVEEAVVLETALMFYERTPLTVVFLDVSEEQVRERMKLRARKDDTDQAIEMRLADYREKTLPVVHYYEERTHTKLIHIDASRDIEAVAADVARALSLV
jgi:adenylate kinase